MLSGYLDKFLMRVLFRKIHCPSFICFCKPSPHIYTNGPLKLENTPHVPPKLVTVPETSDQILCENKVKEEILDEKQQKQQQQPQEEQQEQQQQQQELAQNCLKSNLRKPNSDSGSLKEKQKKTVQWMDLLGKELVEIREFESRFVCSLIFSAIFASKLDLYYG